MTFIETLLLTLFVLVIGPISVYFAVKLGTWAHYRVKYLLEMEMRENEKKSKRKKEKQGP